ncbi:MAG: hypothetical protein V8R46_06705, partial [Eubacterium ramulus]
KTQDGVYAAIYSESPVLCLIKISRNVVATKPKWSADGNNQVVVYFAFALVRIWDSKRPADPTSGSRGSHCACGRFFIYILWHL